MAKFLLLALVIGVVVLLLKNYQRALTRQDDLRTGAPKPTNRGAEAMVQCAHCGIHTPKGESFLSKGQYYCTNEHLKLGPKDSGGSS